MGWAYYGPAAVTDTRPDPFLSGRNVWCIDCFQDDGIFLFLRNPQQPWELSPFAL